jgi:hypothetical protein
MRLPYGPAVPGWCAFHVWHLSAILCPEGVPQPRDSGSPLLNPRGELIGNLWSIVYARPGMRLPYAQVALLPPAIESEAK